MRARRGDGPGRAEGQGMMNIARLAIALPLALVLAGCAGADLAPRAAQSPMAAQPAGSACVLIQRGQNGDVADTRIAESWPSTAYGSADVAFAGKVGNGARQTLMRFDLSGVPAGARITRATVTLHRTSCGCATINLHRVTRAWDEATTTWSSFGGAYEQTALMTLPEGDTKEVGEVSFDVTDLANEWSRDASANHGVLLEQTSANTSFVTSEAADTTERPKLEVCFSAS